MQRLLALAMKDAWTYIADVHVTPDTDAKGKPTVETLDETIPG